MKKTILSILMIMCLLVITGCGTTTKETTSADSKKFKEDYESLNGTVNDAGKTFRSVEIADNRIIYTTAEDVVKKIENKESFVVYFGYPKCPWCRSVVSTLIKLSNELELDIYYVDIHANEVDIRDTLKVENGNVVTSKEGTEAYMKLIQLFDNVLEDYSLTDEDGNAVETGEKRIYAPNVIAIVQGEPIGLTDGISSLQTDGYMELTDEMLAETHIAFGKLFLKYLDETSMCDVDAQTKC